ncbi:MAG: shikimate dehydrogenase [Oscillospiraceae bacterium]|nr:shikimate dehydrogenase [Oscillospiraceae bacterium]
MGKITAHTKHLGIFGFPVEHSFSPVMHNYISDKIGLDYVYTAYEIKPENIGKAVEAIRALGISGVNITAPYKFEVMKYLDETDKQAELFGSVNTVVNRDGRLIGYNTDAFGFYSALERNGQSAEGRDILIFGAGGATKPIAVLFAQKGAKSITIINRTEEKARAIAEYVKEKTGYAINLKKELERYDIAVNTTSAGMAPQLDKCPADDFSFADKNTFFADMIYNPDETIFLKKAKELGAGTMNGLGMLIGQGIISYELFTGVKIGDDMYDNIAKEVFGR